MNLCQSGGAPGADYAWGQFARLAGHEVRHYSYSGHRYVGGPGRVVLSHDELLAADPYCERANETLKRTFPKHKPWVANLLRRNWYQVRDAASCYAVSEIKDGEVDGGTAWAVQMFIDRFDGAACACYVFCQVVGQWYRWDGSGWMPIVRPPVPEGVYAGIGKRALRPVGNLAINAVYQS